MNHVKKCLASILIILSMCLTGCCAEEKITGSIADYLTECIADFIEDALAKMSD